MTRRAIALEKTLEGVKYGEDMMDFLVSYNDRLVRRVY